MADKALFLKPVAGRRVRREDGPLLDDAGEHVSPSPYWTRKLDDGDVVEVAGGQKAEPSRPDAGGTEAKTPRSSSPTGDSASAPRSSSPTGDSANKDS